MSIKPILFNTDMVRAILDGRKTVTRRVIKPQPEMALAYIMAGHKHGKWNYSVFEEEEYKKHRGKEQYWTPPCNGDDILYVRETWCKGSFDVEELSDGSFGEAFVEQRIGDNDYIFKDFCLRNKIRIDEVIWRPSIHMPKEAARIWLKVTNVRVERLQDMSHDAAGEEGIHYCECPDGFTWKTDADMKCCYLTPSGAFKALWNSTVNKEDIASYGWEANPWVWVIEFERCEKPQEDNK